MKKNDVYEIKISGMTDDGSGVGRAENMAVFVPYTIVGETVRVIIIKVNKSYAIGKLTEVVVPSEMRTKAECPYFYKCGGCGLQHMDYRAELEYKQKKVEDCMTRLGGFDASGIMTPIVPSEKVYRYRNKVQMPIGTDGIGFYRRNSHDVIPMTDCLLQSENAREISAAVKEWKDRFGVAAYDEKSGKGELRHIYTREADGGELIVIVTANDKLPHAVELVETLSAVGKRNNFKIAGIIQNVNSKRTNVVLGDKNIVLCGCDKTWDILGGTKFEISPNSFYQVNKSQTVRLYNIAAKAAGLRGGETVWDLYCGIGTIGLFCAKSAKAAKAIVGIECVPQAVENAERNAEINGAANAKYYCGTAEKTAERAVKENDRPDVVFLDPPRKGCDESLLDTVAEVAPNKIVYISCKPSTLARDIKYLITKGYTPKKITPVDMFPRTPHVETVVLLCRKTPDDVIKVKLSLDELELTSAESKATYEKIKEYVMRNFGLKVSTLYIAQTKRKFGIAMGENYNMPKSIESTQPQCPPDKEAAIVKALEHFKMI